jgi:hypothetical protein
VERVASGVLTDGSTASGEPPEQRVEKTLNSVCGHGKEAVLHL